MDWPSAALSWIVWPMEVSCSNGGDARMRRTKLPSCEARASIAARAGVSFDLMRHGAAKRRGGRGLEQVLLVTGASRGIGAATARLAAAKGHAVAVNYASNGAAAEAVVGEIERAGGTAFAVQA